MLAVVVGLCVVSYAAVALINRVFLTRWVAAVLPEGVLVRRVYVRWPATLVVTHARWAATAKPEAPWLQVPRATLDVDLSSLFVRHLVIRRVRLDGPRVQLARDAAGHWNLPSFAGRPASARRAGVAKQSPWRMAVLSVQVKDGTVVVDDLTVPGGFHGELRSCALDVHHPWLSLQGWRAQVTLDARAVLRRDRETAPVHLDGWVDLKQQDAAGTLTVTSFDVGALEPYLNQGRVTVRLYNARLNLTTALTVEHGNLHADCQLELTHLTEGDVSIKGINVLDIKSAAAGHQSLQFRLQLAGPWNQPRAWRRQLVPTGEQTVKLLRPLLEKRKETIILKVIPQVAGEQAAANVQETVKSVQKELKAQWKKLLEAPQLSVPAGPAPAVPQAEAPAPASAPPPPVTAPSAPAPVAAPATAIGAAPAMASPESAAPANATAPSSQAPAANP